MKIALLLFVTYVGYALGGSDLQIRPALVAVTALVAMILHGLIKLALPHEGIERIARSVAWSVVAHFGGGRTRRDRRNVDTVIASVPFVIGRIAKRRQRRAVASQLTAS
mgnify:CR=1 FL=1